MSNRNQTQLFNTLVGGIEFGLLGSSRGTLGMLLSDVNNDRWAVSAAHVLTAAMITDVLQPLISFPGRKIADTSNVRFDLNPNPLDCAAVRIDPMLAAMRDEILAIGPVAQPIQPQFNMRVLKCGAASGVTEGVIDNIQGDIITIILPNHYPPTSNLTDKGDSGCVWVKADTHEPVALHCEGNSGGAEWSRAINFLRVCQVLGLNVP